MRLATILTALCASALAHPVLEARQYNPRASWGDYNLSTNYYDAIPDTGVVREYWFNLVNVTAAPDGRERTVLLVNGTLPGPTIIADWGDTVVVHVTNSMQNNGTSIHFHGVRQLDTNQMDGVASLTQCPTAPGESYTYTWRASEYGSSWYHSHFSLQAWNGVFGGITINGPASADYDEDVGSLFLNDWDVLTADQMYLSQVVDPWVPQFSGGLLNGTNVYDYGNGTQVGQRLNIDFVPGKRYRMRLISAALHTDFKFSIDNHNMTIIANDFVPIYPVESNFVAINSGQRYDVIVEASQAASNYWMRAVPQTSCSNNTRSDDIKGVIHYDNAPVELPTSTKQVYPDDNYCFDMNMYGYVTEPVLALDVYLPGASNTSDLVSVQDEQAPNTTYPPMELWRIGDTAFDIYWNDPTLLDIATINDPVWAQGQRVLLANVPNQWNVVVMQNNFTLAHPIHLHGKSPSSLANLPPRILTPILGHDFWVLASGIGEFDPRTVPLNTKNPTRRDTATLTNTGTTPGYLVIAFPADNPGTWLLHCHVGFHATEGFAMQIVERLSEIPALIDQDVLNATCDSWNAYSQENVFGRQNKAYVGQWESGV